MTNALSEIFIYLIAACVTVSLLSRFKLGAVLGYICAGIVIGPHVFGMVENSEYIRHISEFGVVMMLFVIGLELEPAILWRMRHAILGLGGLQVLVTTAALSGIGVLLGYSWQISLVIGMALSLSSTAMVLQILKEKNLLNTPMGESSFSVLLFQDMAVIPILVIIPLLTMQGGGEGVAHAGMITHLPAFMQALIVSAVIALLIFAGRYASPHVFRAVAKSNQREVFTALSLALVVGITLLMHMLGISPALGAFIAGLVLAGSEYRRTIETDIEPFKGLLLGLFFISVGIGIDFTLLARDPLMIMFAVLGLMLCKALILIALLRFFGFDSMQSIGGALALAQGGEFAFVLFQFAGGLAILTPELSAQLTLIVALSMTLTPLVMIWYTRKIVPHFMSVLSEHTFDRVVEQSPIIIAGFGRFGQVVGRFLMAQNVKVTVLEKDPNQIELIRKFGFKGYFGDAARLDLLRVAGAETSSAIVVAVDDVETSLAIIRMVKEEFPALTIFARARNRQHSYDLYKLGVYFFKRELFDSSLDMAREIMVWMGRPKEEVMQKSEHFRTHDEETLRESFGFFEDQNALVNFSKTRRLELETILQADTLENFVKSPTNR